MNDVHAVLANQYMSGKVHPTKEQIASLRATMLTILSQVRDEREWDMKTLNTYREFVEWANTHG